MTFGKIDKVFHETNSSDIHLDILCISPTTDHPFYKFITMGMGAYPMTVPKFLKSNDLKHAELLLFLPANWDLISEKWPLDILQELARLPLQRDTWLGHGHTVQCTENDHAFAKNTEMNSVLLLSGLDYESIPLYFCFNRKHNINFYHIFPIYQEEYNYIIKNPLENFIDKIDEKYLDCVIDINRKKFV